MDRLAGEAMTDHPISNPDWIAFMNQAWEDERPREEVTAESAAANLSLSSSWEAAADSAATPSEHPIPIQLLAWAEYARAYTLPQLEAIGEPGLRLDLLRVVAKLERTLNQ